MRRGGSVAFAPPDRFGITVNPYRKFLLCHAAAATEEGDSASGCGITGEGEVTEKSDDSRQRLDAGVTDSAFPKLEGAEVYAKTGSNFLLLEAQVEAPLFDVVADGLGFGRVTLHRLPILSPGATHLL